MPNIINVIGLLTLVPFLSGYDDGKYACGEILKMINAKLTVTGLEHVDEFEPRIYIANHSSYVDFAVIFYILKACRETHFLMGFVYGLLRLRGGGPALPISC